ncbi:MAG: hypothetical protein EHM61_08860 [Acidobacteria bacterium]|nr:MAG: hypothetical protein EHM61_08860 [Acidobacteriota bacterium]
MTAHEPAGQAGAVISPREHLLALAVYLVLSLVTTYPLARHLNTALLGDGDAWLFVWNFWWWRFALANGVHPFCTDFIHYPTGICAYLHTWNFANTWATLPLQSVLSVTTLYNLCSLATFVFAGWGMFRLAGFLGVPPLGAFLAGLAYSFNAYHYGEANGHLNIMTYQWIPFFLQAMIQGLERWTRSRLVIAALWLTLVALSDWYYLLFCVLGTGILVGSRLTFERRGAWTMLGGAVLVGVLTSLLLSPLLIGMIGEAGSVPQERVAADFSPDLLSFVLPAPTTSYTNWLGPLHDPWARLTSEASTPWTVLTLIPVGIFALRGWNRRWVSIWTALFFILSLGPVLHVAGHTVDRFLLPYGWLEKSPGFFLVRTPIRMHIMTWVGLSLLYATGAVWIMGQRGRVWKAGLLAVLFLLETLSVPFGLSHPDISPFYRQLRSSPGQLALIDLHYNSKTLFYQTVHQQKVMGLPSIVSRQTFPALHYLHETHGIHQLLEENQLIFFANSTPSGALQQASSLLPGRFSLLLAGYSEIDGEIEVRSSVPHRLQTQDRFYEGRENRVSISRNDLFVVRLEMRAEDLRLSQPPVRLWIGGKEIEDGPAAIARPILPTVRVPLQPTGITCIFYPNTDSDSPDSSASERIRAEGFDWIIVPFYGNDHYVRVALGLRPVYQDRWLSAYKVGE